MKSETAEKSAKKTAKKPKTQGTVGARKPASSKTAVSSQAPEVPVSPEENNGYTGPLPMFNGKPMVLTREAWLFYITPQAEGHERIRNYLRLQDVGKLAEAMRRPLTVEDLKDLVGPDGEEQVCSVSQKETHFQPMWWVLITRALIENLKEGKTLKEVIAAGTGVVYAGQFMFRNGKIWALSGTPYWWRKGEEEDKVDSFRPLGASYYRNNHHWPDTLTAAQELQRSKADRQQGLTHMWEVLEKDLGLGRQNNGGGKKHHKRNGRNGH